MAVIVSTYLVDFIHILLIVFFVLTLSAWFESAVLFTHLVLADLTLIIQPDVFAKYSVNGNGYNTTFFRNIYKTSSQITLTSAMCSAADNTTLQIPSIDCSQLTTSSSGAASTVFGHGGGWTVAGSLMIGFVALIMNV